jgi:hypothetical protein
MRSYVSSKFSVRSLGLALGLACAALSASMQSANAVPVAVNTWNEFGFDGVGSPLRSGIGTVPATNPPDGNPVVQVGDPPWTFTLASPAALNLVLDLFFSVYQFEIFDKGASLGLTSTPTPGGDCGGDITCSLDDPRFSRGMFFLGAGNHSLTGIQTAGIPGAGVFEITPVPPVPEPASLSVLGAALIGFGLFRRRKNRA